MSTVRPARSPDATAALEHSSLGPRKQIWHRQPGRPCCSVKPRPGDSAAPGSNHRGVREHPRRLWGPPFHLRPIALPSDELPVSEPRPGPVNPNPSRLPSLARESLSTAQKPPFCMVCTKREIFSLPPWPPAAAPRNRLVPRGTASTCHSVRTTPFIKPSAPGADRHYQQSGIDPYRPRYCSSPRPEWQQELMKEAKQCIPITQPTTLFAALAGVGEVRPPRHAAALRAPSRPPWGLARRHPAPAKPTEGDMLAAPAVLPGHRSSCPKV